LDPVAKNFICMSVIYFAIAALFALPMLTSIWLTYFMHIPAFNLVGDCFRILFTGIIVAIILSFIYRERASVTN
jgi:hypothetical protein